MFLQRARLPLITLQRHLTARIMSASPPHKRLRSDTSVPAAPVASSSSVDVNMNEAPVNAMLPGAVASTSTENPDSSSTNAATVPGQTKQEGQKGKGKISKRKMRRVLPDEYSAGDVLFRDVCDFLGPEYVDGLIAKKSQAEWDAPEGLEQYSEVTVRVGTFTVSGMYLLPPYAVCRNVRANEDECS